MTACCWFFPLGLLNVTWLSLVMIVLNMFVADIIDNDMLPAGQGPTLCQGFTKDWYHLTCLILPWTQFIKNVAKLAYKINWLSGKGARLCWELPKQVFFKGLKGWVIPAPGYLRAGTASRDQRASARCRCWQELPGWTQRASTHPKLIFFNIYFPEADTTLLTQHEC